MAAGAGTTTATTALPKKLIRRNSNASAAAAAAAERGGGGRRGNGDDRKSTISQQQQQQQSPSLLSSRFGRGSGGGGGGSGSTRSSSSTSNHGRLRTRRFLCSSIAIASLLCLVLMNLVYLHGRIDVQMQPSSASPLSSASSLSSASAAAVQQAAHLSMQRLRSSSNYYSTRTRTRTAAMDTRAVASEQQQESTTQRRRQTEAIAAASTSAAGRALALSSSSFHGGGGVYENDILKRIHWDLQTKWTACAFQQQQQKQQQQQQQQQQQDGQHSYKRYGLLQVLDEYLAEHKDDQTINSTHGSLQKKSSSSSSSCVVPEASFTACNVTSMALIAYTSATTTTTASSNDNHHHHEHDGINHRRVLLSILQWLLDPYVKEIWLLVPIQQRPSFVNNSAYGQRLLFWEFHGNTNDNVNYQQQQGQEPFRNNNPGQQVFVVFCESLMHGVSIVEAESQEMAMLWMNAHTAATSTTTPNDSISTDTRNNLLQAWKQEASAIHVSLPTAFMMDWQGSSTAPATSSLRLALASSSSSSSSSSCPFQPSSSTRKRSTQEEHWQQPQRRLPELAGTMHHRSYLCFLRHAVLVKSITAMPSSSPIESSSWLYSFSAVWLWLVASSSSSSSSTTIPGVVYLQVDKKAATAKGTVQDEKLDHSFSDSPMWFYFGGPTEMMTRVMNATIQQRHYAQSSLCATSNVTKTQRVSMFWN